MSQRDLLLRLYNATQGEFWTQKWNLSAPISRWYGVSLNNNGDVVSLSLANNNLNGILPTSIGDLSSLTSLDLNTNGRLKGSIPSSIRQLTNLAYLYLGSCHLSGPIPDIFSSMPQLQGLSVSNNTLTGSFPASIGQITALTYLDISLNRLQGPVPAVFSGLVNLNFLNILSNDLTGRLGEDLCGLSITFVYLDPTVCYAYCLSSAIQVFDLRTISPNNGNTTRCQSLEDLAVCAIAAQTNIHDQLSVTTFDTPICSPSNYSACQNTKLNFSPPTPGLLVNTTELFRVPGAVRLRVSFNAFTDQYPNLLLFCTTSSPSSCLYNLTGISVNQLPGVNNNPPLLIEGDQFYMYYISHTCGALTFYNTACWGYQIFVDASVSYKETGGWVCSPPPSAAVAIRPSTDPFWLTSAVPYDQSYAENFNSWYGITTVNNIINVLDLSSIFISFSGRLPENIGYLTSLERFDLYSNNFTGPIPEGIGYLTGLSYISISFNSFTGSLAPIAKLDNLLFLSATSNQLSGEIPYNILAPLISADISNNKFAGQLPTSLCNLTLANLNVAGNLFSCYPSCLQSSVQTRSLTVGSIGICSPSSAPTPSPVSSGPLTKEALLGIEVGVGLGFPLLLIMIGCVVYFYWRKTSAAFLRKERLRSLPVHKAIIKHLPVEEVMKRISNSSDTIAEKDFDGLTAFDLAVDPRYERQDSKEQQDILLRLVENTLPVHPEFRSERPSSQHGFLWSRIVQSDRHISVVNEVVDMYRHIAHELAYSTDAEGRPVLNIASPLCQHSIRQSLYFLKRYEFLTPVESPFHKSATCMLLMGVDHHSGAEDDDAPDEKVALKFMLLKEQFLNEVNIRKNAEFDPEFVIGILSVYDGDTDGMYRKETVSKGIENFKYSFTMPAADRNLATIISSERIAGKDWAQIKLVAMNVAAALGHVHSKGYIHGDVKPLNIVRLQNKYKLIDFDASAEIDRGFSGYKFSSAYSPPELVYEEKGGDSYIIKSFFIDPATLMPMTEILPYSLVRASPAHDVWSLGVVLYELCSGIKLFLCDDEDNMDEMELKTLYEFSDEFKKRKLLRVHDMMARNLLAQLLTKDPARRPHIDAILAHPFISGGKATRLVGEAPEFDVFLSYRVRSDADHALQLYELLTKKGVKVWLDVKCLEPGVSWEQGFADGLVKSRVFVPILSRGAINDKENIRCDFSRLNEDSPCDNVLLEHILALEFHQRELIERIYPVMIGDLKAGIKMYGQYFVDGCHPKLEGAVTVHSVEAQVEFHLNRLRLGTPLRRDMTVSGVCKEIVSKQGKLVEGPQSAALNAAVDDIDGMVKVLLNRDRLNLDSIASKMKGLAKRAKGTDSPVADANPSLTSSTDSTEATKPAEIPVKPKSDNSKYLTRISRSIRPVVSPESKIEESIAFSSSANTSSARTIELTSPLAPTPTPAPAISLPAEAASEAAENEQTLAGIESSQLQEESNLMPPVPPSDAPTPVTSAYSRLPTVAEGEEKDADAVSVASSSGREFDSECILM